MMPGTNGIEVARRLRADGFPKTPMVAMSASSNMLAAASQSLLFADTMAKPFDLEILMETVERFAAA
ncbi:MAG: DNA-binding response regulator, partial [Chloroflexota bacterium]